MGSEMCIRDSSDTDALTVDHEYRITLLELGINDTEGDAETT